MERIGKINQYTCRKCGKSQYCVNLNTGVTPFGMGCHACGHSECYSRMYRVNWTDSCVITFAWFRPTKELFYQLPPDTKYHVMEGGLIADLIEKVVPLREFPELTLETTHEEWKQFAATIYGEECLEFLKSPEKWFYGRPEDHHPVDEVRHDRLDAYSE